MKTLLILIFLFPFIAFTQDSSMTPKAIITFHPIQLIDPFKPAIRGGAEFRIADRYTMELDGGYSPFRRSGFKGRIELKRYSKAYVRSNGKPPSVYKYISIGAFTNYYEFEEEGQLDEPIDDDYKIIADVYLTHIGTDLRFGLWLANSKHLTFNMYGGFGIQQHIREQHGSEDYWVGGGFFAVRKMDRMNLLPKLSAGIKLGWKIH